MEDRNLVNKLREEVSTTTEDNTETTVTVTHQDENIREVTPQNPKLIPQGSLVNTIDDYDKSQWVKLRTDYANKLYYLLCGEILGVFGLLLLIGCKTIEIPESTLDITIIAITAHTFGLVREIVTNLFKK